MSQDRLDLASTQQAKAPKITHAYINELERERDRYRARAEAAEGRLRALAGTLARWFAAGDPAQLEQERQRLTRQLDTAAP